jgi:hypothetical protein
LKTQDAAVWSAQDRQSLRELREAAGLDPASAARIACLSLAQWSELEEGGHSHFYTQQIMALAGRRAMIRLGPNGRAALKERLDACAPMTGKQNMACDRILGAGSPCVPRDTGGTAG